MAETIQDIRARLSDPQAESKLHRAQTHSPVTGDLPALQSTNTSGETIQDIRNRLATSDFSAAQQEEGLRRQSMTHRPGTSANVTGPVDFSTIDESPSSMLDKPSRVALAKDMAMAGRLGLETLGMVTGGIAAKPVRHGGEILVKKGADYIARQLAARRVVSRGALRESTGRALGEATGSLLSQPFDPVENPLERARNIALFSGFADFGAGGAIRAYDRIRRGGTRLEPGAKSTVKILAPGRSPSPGRLSRSPVVDVTENILENSVPTAGMISRRNESAARRGVQYVDNLVARYLKGATRTQVDDLIVDVVERRGNSYKALQEGMYGELDDLAPGGVSTDRIISTRNKIAREAAEEGLDSRSVDAIIEGMDKAVGVPVGLRGRHKSPTISSTPIRRLMRKGDPGFDPRFNAGEFIEVRTAEPVTSFRKAAAMRSDAIKATPDPSDVANKKLSGATRRATSALHDSMAATAASQGEDVLRTWLAANEFTVQGSDLFFSGAMRRLAIAEPDRVLTTILQNDAPQQITAFRKLVLGGVGGSEDTARTIRASANRVIADKASSPRAIEAAKLRLKDVDDGEKAWDTIVGQFMMNLRNTADASSSLATEAAKGNRIVQGSKLLDAINSVGDDTLKALFPNQTARRQFERLARAIDIAQEGTGLSTGRMAAQFVQAGAFFQLVTGSASFSTYMIIAGPTVIGLLARSEKFATWATTAATRPATSRSAQLAFRNMVAFARKSGATIMDQDGNEVPPPPETNLSKNLKDFIGVTSQRGQR